MANRFTGKSKRGRRTPGRKLMKKRWSSRRRKYKRGEFDTRMQSGLYYDRWQPTQTSTVTAGSYYTYVGSILKLDDINSGDLGMYQAMFDQYRIVGVEIAFRSLTNPDASYAANTTTTVNANNFFMDLYVVCDNDDANTPTSVEYMQAYGKKLKMCVLKPNVWQHYSFRPKVQRLLYMSVTSAYEIPSRNPWINCANASVPHYAIKYAIGSPFNNLQPMTYEYRLRYKIAFKNNH
jgi:hypothetical protein